MSVPYHPLRVWIQRNLLTFSFSRECFSWRFHDERGSPCHYPNFRISEDNRDRKFVDEVRIDRRFGKQLIRLHASRKQFFAYDFF
jgi:hypothetical protein